MTSTKKTSEEKDAKKSAATQEESTASERPKRARKAKDDKKKEEAAESSGSEHEGGDGKDKKQGKARAPRPNLKKVTINTKEIAKELKVDDRDVVSAAELIAHIKDYAAVKQAGADIAAAEATK